MLYQCSVCGYQASVIAGTIFGGTRKPLTIWFRAIWGVVSQKNGASALGIKRVLGLGSYETAWTWLHKLRRAMVGPSRDRLSGLIRMLRIPDASRKNLHSFIAQAIEPGSIIRTDGWEGYSGREAKGYTHEVRVIKGSGTSAVKLLPRVHRVVSLLKRWILGTHQGAISPEHLDYYLDELTFRFNRRTSRHRGKLFYRPIQHALAIEPVRYGDIIKHVRGPKKRNHNI